MVTGRMGKKLVIAEKPSVMADIARALGGFKKEADHYESDEYVVASAVGHLLELAVPEVHDIKRGKWSFEHLPHLPPEFTLEPIDRSKSKLATLRKLSKRPDVTGLVNACDAGREGELIFRNIVQHLKLKQPIQRLWLQSMTRDAIRDGFAKLRADQELLPLADSAVCRSEADWLVGINGTRAMTAFNSRNGGFQLTTVGRVQTPTLAMVVARERLILGFKPRTYHEVHAVFGAAEGTYPGRWFDETFDARGVAAKADDALKAERLWDADRAESIRARCDGKPGVVEKDERTPRTQVSPLLYDLTSLQRDANQRFGFSARRTLQIAQALYERHKALTYPRTDSRYLPDDYLPTVRRTLEEQANTGPSAQHARKLLDAGWLVKTKRVFNQAKVSDHFAIIPTPQVPTGLDEMEARLYQLVVKRFIAVFFPAAQFEETTRVTRVEGEPFLTKGKVLRDPGWMAVYGKEAQDDDDAENPPLAAVTDGETVRTDSVEVRTQQTKPPARYNEGTLLSAMENAGKTVEDEELREAMKERGIGTPATRAQVIEGLIDQEYLRREGRELSATPKALALMEQLDVLQINELRSPEMTGEWEFKLRRMEHRELGRPEFMQEIRALTAKVVAAAKGFDESRIPARPAGFNAPDGRPLMETLRAYATEDGTFKISKVIGGRLLTPDEARVLVTEGAFGPVPGFRSRLGKPFAARLVLDAATGAVTFDFGNGAGGDANAPVDFTGQEPLGKCPKCGASVYAAGSRYLCEKATGENRACDFTSSSVILQQPVPREEFVKLLSEGKTSLLDGFVSSRTNRKFKAYLVVKDGKVSFEFEKREGGAARGRRGGAKAEQKPVDFSTLTAVAKCPKCGGKVYDAGEAYLCGKSQAETKRCTFKVGKVVCQRTITPEEVAALTKDGRTAVIPDFVSKAGKPFAARLVLEGKGKVGFEFAPRDGGGDDDE
jgi:DNA topoisomerase-3